MQALTFVLTTLFISWTQQYFIIKGDGISNPVPVFALMWTPGLVGIFCAFYFDRNFKSLGINRPSISSLLISYFTPVLAAVVMVTLLVMFNISEFQVSPKLIEMSGGLKGALTKALLVAPTVGMVVATISALGEEIGWRGFLHSRFNFLAPNRRYFWTGLIWSIWHWPLIFFGDYATSDLPWLNVIFFSVAATSLSFVMGRLRDKTGAVFPAVILHASHNLWVSGIAPAFLKSGRLAPYLADESGLFCASFYFILAIYISRMRIFDEETLRQKISRT